METEQLVELEAMIDKHGLYGIAQQIAEICYGKAEHLQSNWQDKEAARRWTHAGKVFDSVETRLHKIQLD